MRRFRTIGILALTLTAIAMAQDAVTLRRELKANTQDIYKVEMTAKSVTDVPTVGPQEMTMKATMNYAFKTGEVKESKADLDTVMTDLNIQMEGPLAEMLKQQGGGLPEMPKEVVFKGKIDSRNRISELKFQGKMDLMTMNMANASATMAMFVEFPEGQVKPGDTWKMVLPKNAFIGNEDSDMTATLVGEKDGKWLVKMSGEMKLKPDMKELMKGQDLGGGAEMDIKVTGTMKLDTEALIDKTSGKTVEMTTKMDSKSTTEIVNMGMTVDQSGQGTFKMVLKG